MTRFNEFRCEVCGRVARTPVLWFVIRSRESYLTILPWSTEAAHAPGAAHICGELDAQIYISRWLDLTLCGNKALPIPDAEPLRATASDNPNGCSCRERRRASGAVPVRGPREQMTSQRG